MKTFPSLLLRNWPSLWRYPDLAALLATDMAEIDTKTAALTIARGINKDTSPADVLRSLLDVKNFRTANFLLGTKAFREQAGGAFTLLAAEAADAIRRARFELLARRFELEARANRLGQTPEVSEEELERAFNEDPLAADLLLTTWAREIEKGEQEKHEEIERGLAEMERVVGSDSALSWAGAIHRYVKTNRFDLAAKLLSGGPATPTSEADPESVPRVPRWHYDFPTQLTARILRGIEPPPDVGFAERWCPREGDSAAERLLDWLGTFGTREFTGTADDVGNFARLLDEFITGVPAPVREVDEFDNGYCTRVFGAKDTRILRLAVGPSGIPLWFPRTPDQTIHSSLADESTLLAFHPERPPLGRAGVIGFDARVLYPLFHDSSFRKANFLRRLMLNVSIKDAIPAEVDLGVITDEEVDPAWSYAAWFVDYLGIQIDSPATLDLIAFYGSGKAGVIITLLASLVTSVGDRYATVSATDVHRVWMSASFRDAVGKLLFSPLAGDPVRRLVLGCTYYLVGGGEKVELHDLKAFLADGWDYHEGDAVFKAVEGLDAAGLLDFEDAKLVHLSNTGVTHLVRTAMGNPEQYIQAATCELL